MKTAIILLGLCVCSISVHAQANFTNLNLESANVSGYAPGIDGPYNVPVFTGTPVNPVNITMGDLGSLGSDGNLWTSLPNDATKTITPTVNGAPWYYFSLPNAQKYLMRMFANNKILGTGRIRPSAHYCVGQKINLSYAVNPPIDSDVEADYVSWALPGTFVNYLESWPAGATKYLISWPLLNQADTSAWWVTDGQKNLRCDLWLTFNNGQKVHIYTTGQMAMYTPTLGSFFNSPDGLNAGMIAYIGSYYSVWLFGNMPWRLFINSTFNGYMGVTQLADLSGTGYKDTGGAFDLDGSEIYGLGLPNDGDYSEATGKRYDTSDTSSLAHSISFIDNPQTIQLPSVQMIGQFNDYVRFKPDPADGSDPSDSIWITLGIVNWNMDGAATYPLSTPPTLDLPPANDPVPSNEFPFWSNTVW